VYKTNICQWFPLFCNDLGLIILLYNIEIIGSLVKTYVFKTFISAALTRSIIVLGLYYKLDDWLINVWYRVCQSLDNMNVLLGPDLG
jgi:hypothetical protein